MTTENYLQVLMDLKPGLSALQDTITSYLVVTSASLATYTIRLASKRSSLSSVTRHGGAATRGGANADFRAKPANPVCVSWRTVWQRFN